MEPGPRAQTPWFMPISSAIGPETSTIGAWGPVDMAQVRSPMEGSRMHSIMAMITGMVSGLHPAITALAAILRTVPIPKPGAKSPTTWSPLRPEASTMASTLLFVGAMSGNPSLQPLRMNSACIASNASNRSPPSNTNSGAEVSVIRSNWGRSSRCARSIVRPSTTAGMASSTIWLISSVVLLEKHSGTMTGQASGTPKVSVLKWASS